MKKLFDGFQVGQSYGRPRKKLKGQEAEDILALFIAVVDIVVAIVKSHFGLFDILDVFSVSQDFMTIGQMIREALRSHD